MDKGESFSRMKHDRSTTVGVMKGEVIGLTGLVLVKRFNFKGFFDFLLKIVSGGRAYRLWKISRRLLDKGLPVPFPLAYAGPSFRWRHSCFLSSYIKDAENLGALYKKEGFREPGRMAENLGRAVAAWHLSGAVHGDLKWSNILLRKEGEEWRFFFVDLEQARLFRKINMRGALEDLVRFYRYGLELGAEEWVASSFFPCYAGSLPAQVRDSISLDAVRERARLAWEEKGRKRA